MRLSRFKKDKSEHSVSHGLKMHSRAATPATVEMALLKDNQSETLSDFIRENFNQRKCNLYIPDPNKSDESCFCGRTKDWHDDLIADESEESIREWTTEHCTSVGKCDTFGRVHMRGFPKSRVDGNPFFLRLSYNKNDNENIMEKVWQLLIANLKVKQPYLIISINGGNKRMEKIDQRLSTSIRNGLLKVSNSLNTWLITGGVYVGTSQLIGEAAQEISILGDNELSVIGIAPFGTICKRHELRTNFDDEEKSSSKDLPSVYYYNDVNEVKKGQVMLDPNHTHYLLIDDGTQYRYGCELDFRADFENFAHEKMLRESDCTIEEASSLFIYAGGAPVVQVLINGAIAAIRMAMRALERDVPIIAVKGTGRFADLLDKMKNWSSTRTESELLQMTLCDLHENPLDFTPDEKMDLLNKLVKLVKEKAKIIYVYDPDLDAQASLDTVILEAVLNSQKSSQFKYKLYLTLLLDRVDLAKRFVFTNVNRRQIKRGDLDEFVHMALKNDQIDFVKLFLEEGVVMEKFLTLDNLFKLYKNTLHNSEENSNRFDIMADYIASKLQFPHGKDYRGLLKVNKFLYKMCEQMISDWYREEELVSEEDSRPSVVKCERQHDENDGGDSLALVKRGMGLMPTYKHGPIQAILEGKTSKPKQPKFPRYEYISDYGKASGGAKHKRRVYDEIDAFLWAILFNRKELAKIFWRQGKDQISTALIGAAILKNLSKEINVHGEVTLAKELEVDSKEFEELALEVLSVAYAKDKKSTYILLHRCLPEWNNNTCLSLAFQFSLMHFLNHPACRSWLQQVWMGSIPFSTPTYKIILNIPIFTYCTIFPANKMALHSAGGGGGGDGRVEKGKSKQDFDERRNASLKMKTKPTFRPPVERSRQESHNNYLSQRQRENYPKNYWQGFEKFYSAPVTKFIMHVMSYLAFLLILTYFILVELRPIESIRDISAVEWFIWIWCSTMIMEEIRQITVEEQRGISKITDWLTYRWNWVDLFLIILFILCIPLRIHLTSDWFQQARNAYALLCAIFYIRLLQFYYASKEIGPKVIMVFKMVNDVFFFLYLFVIFIFAYGIFAHALIYHNTQLDIFLPATIISIPYWQTFGELHLENLQGNDSCVEGMSDCPHASYLVKSALVVFLLASHVLLINLLIAMFGHTFTRVQCKSEVIWAFHRYGLVWEFLQRPTLPLPWNAFSFFVWLVKYVMNKCEKVTTDTALRKQLLLDEHVNISNFEQRCMEIFWHEKVPLIVSDSLTAASRSNQQLASKIDEALQKIEILEKSLKISALRE